jgi:cell division protein FtsQ
VVGLLLLLGVFGGGLWYGARHAGPGFIRWVDQFFEIRNVEMPDRERVSRDEVLALLDVVPGRGLLRVDLKELEQSVAAHPWVRRAEVRRRFPHTLIVDMEERVPVAVLRTGGGRDFLLDKDGRLLTEGISEADEGLPALTGVDYVKAIFGTEETVERIRSGIALVGLLDQAGAGRTEVDLRLPGELVAYYSGIRLRFPDGPFEDMVERYRLVSDRMFERRGGTAPAGRAVEVDLRFRDRIIVRERG